MTDAEQTEAFSDELDKLVRCFEKEFQLSKASAVGCLEFKAFAIMLSAFDADGEESLNE